MVAKMTERQNDSVDQFVQQLLAERPVAGETSAAYNRRCQAVRNQLMTVVDKAVINSLQPDQLNQLSTALDAKLPLTDDQLIGFFHSCGVDYQTVILRAMAQFRDDFLARKEQA